MAWINRGETFGRLVVKGPAGKNARGRRLWKCACICGGRKVVNGTALRTGITRSCGCLQKETVKIVNTTHGQSKTRTYVSWMMMMNRCYNPKRKDYALYGGSSVRVALRWHVYENFLEDMGARPIEMSLERIDNKKGYSITNCRWATHKEQCLNRSTNVLLTYGSRTQPLSVWAKEKKKAYTTLQWRYHAGWSTHEIINGRH